MNPITPTSPTFNAGDPVVVAMEKRASELSLALNPKAVGRRLRDELVATVGADKAVAYYVGVTSDDGETVRFEIARLGPKFLFKLIGGDPRFEKNGVVKLSYEHTTGNGWRISIGAAAAVPYQRPKGARIQGSFSVLIAR